MEILTKIPKFPLSISKPIALTMGTFDGLHLGHQAILHRLKYLTKDRGTSCVITFKNNPKTLLNPLLQIRNLATVEHKMHLLNRFKIDLTLLLPFDQEIASLSYDGFIKKIFSLISFDYFILGKGAAFGKNKEGNEERLKSLGQFLGFKTEYLQKVRNAGKDISSGRIRDLLEKGSLREVENLLGRPYSIYTTIQTPKAFDKITDINTLAIPLKDLCCLPKGTYAIKLVDNASIHPCIGVINPEKRDEMQLFFKGNVTPLNEIEFFILGKLSEPSMDLFSHLEENLQRANQLIKHSTWNF